MSDLFAGRTACFLENVPEAHVSAWSSNEGKVLDWKTSSAISADYLFCGKENEFPFSVTQGRVVFFSKWIVDSLTSHKREPLNSYIAPPSQPESCVLSSFLSWNSPAVAKRPVRDAAATASEESVNESTQADDDIGDSTNDLEIPMTAEEQPAVPVKPSDVARMAAAVPPAEAAVPAAKPEQHDTADADTGTVIPADAAAPVIESEVPAKDGAEKLLEKEDIPVESASAPVDSAHRTPDRRGSSRKRKGRDETSDKNAVVTSESPTRSPARPVIGGTPSKKLRPTEVAKVDAIRIVVQDASPARMAKRVETNILTPDVKKSPARLRGARKQTHRKKSKRTEVVVAKPEAPDSGREEANEVVPNVMERPVYQRNPVAKEKPALSVPKREKKGKKIDHKREKNGNVVTAVPERQTGVKANESPARRVTESEEGPYFGTMLRLMKSFRSKNVYRSYRSAFASTKQKDDPAKPAAADMEETGVSDVPKESSVTKALSKQSNRDAIIEREQEDVSMDDGGSGAVAGTSKGAVPAEESQNSDGPEEHGGVHTAKETQGLEVSKGSDGGDVPMEDCPSNVAKETAAESLEKRDTLGEAAVALAVTDEQAVDVSKGAVSGDVPEDDPSDITKETVAAESLEKRDTVGEAAVTLAVTDEQAVDVSKGAVSGDVPVEDDPSDVAKDTVVVEGSEKSTAVGEAECVPPSMEGQAVDVSKSADRADVSMEDETPDGAKETAAPENSKSGGVDVADVVDGSTHTANGDSAMEGSKDPTVRSTDVATADERADTAMGEQESEANCGTDCTKVTVSAEAVSPALAAGTGHASEVPSCDVAAEAPVEPVPSNMTTAETTPAPPAEAHVQQPSRPEDGATAEAARLQSLKESRAAKLNAIFVGRNGRRVMDVSIPLVKRIFADCTTPVVASLKGLKAFSVSRPAPSAPAEALSATTPTTTSPIVQHATSTAPQVSPQAPQAAVDAPNGHANDATTLSTEESNAILSQSSDARAAITDDNMAEVNASAATQPATMPIVSDDATGKTDIAKILQEAEGNELDDLDSELEAFATQLPGESLQPSLPMDDLHSNVSTPGLSSTAPIEQPIEAGIDLTGDQLLAVRLMYCLSGNKELVDEYMSGSRTVQDLQNSGEWWSVMDDERIRVVGDAYLSMNDDRSFKNADASGLAKILNRPEKAIIQRMRYIYCFEALST